MAEQTDLELARYAAMRWNTPLSCPHAQHLIEQFNPFGADAVVDLGCGWGELLLDVLDAAPGSRGIGVDSDPVQLARGRARAAERGLQHRVEFVTAAAESWNQTADRVVCIGASQAWQGSSAALQGLNEVVAPGGLLLFGDGFWQTPPTEAATAIFGDDVPTLDGLLASALAAGWRVLSATTADQREWDEFESSWRRGREHWLAVNPTSVEASDVRHRLDERLSEYYRVYRGVLGFAYLTLSRS